MILSINGWPGVGKRTVGIALCELLNGKMLDNHTLINPAKALADYGTAEYYQIVRAVREIAFEALKALPPEVPVVLTNVIATGGPSDFAREHWGAIRALAAERGSFLYSVTLDCDAPEQARRIASSERKSLMKMSDIDAVTVLKQRRALFDDGADFSVAINNTELTAKACAVAIEAWVSKFQP